MLKDTHIDVLQVINSVYRERICNGEKLTSEELKEINEIMNEIEMRMDEQNKQFKESMKEIDNNIKLFGKRLDTQDKLFSCFLEMHNLDDEFDNFCHRVYRRMHKNRNEKEDRL